MWRWLLLAVVQWKVASCNIFLTPQDCPTGWFVFSDVCYNFVFHPARKYQEAVLACDQGMGSLLIVRTLEQHNFIQSWLKTHDSSRSEWLTSGVRDSSGHLIWETDGTSVDRDYFSERESQVNNGSDWGNGVIVYKYIASASEYTWFWSKTTTPRPYICQIYKSDVWKLYQAQRDFSYGTNISDPNMWETGPNITYISPDTVFYKTEGQVTTVVLDCQATGNPQPTYKWLKRIPKQKFEVEVTTERNNRVTMSNGRLVITEPNPVADSTLYSCVVSNKLGTAVSTRIEVSYGYIDEFPNVQQSSVLATMFMGTELTCQALAHNTELTYNWFKSGMNFIRPELNSQYFLSRNGNLYISEVQASDQGDYFCIVSMAAQYGRILSGDQPPTRTSLGVELKVNGENANSYGPEIHDKFPQVFPVVPLVGSDVEIECLSYGRLPLSYSWVREDAPLHPKSYLKDHNRVLVIPSAGLEDTGIYTCVVKGDKNMANKTVHLSMKAKPSFPFQLKHQHVDAGSRLVWACHADGVPRPVYTWYKNGVRLNATQGSVAVRRNTLTIDHLEVGQHEGVYQCEAINEFGSARSTAQLRVLYFAPTFQRSPVAASQVASVGGNVSIPCRPEASPRANIRWLRNGTDAGWGVLPSGALHLSALVLSDSGKYTCVASNDLGEARSTCLLIIQEAAVFTELPSNVKVKQNETTALNCHASVDEREVDVAYYWSFFSHVIDMSEGSDDRIHFWMPRSSSYDQGKLSIINAQYRHEGEYTCTVVTVSGTLQASAHVTVEGPPGQPSGVHVRRRSNENASAGYEEIFLMWQDGPVHGYPATKYRIEFSSVYDTEWQTLRDNVRVQETRVDEFPDWRTLSITQSLSPGNTYRFRVQASNDQVGPGDVSGGPYKWYTVASAPPVRAPENVGGGGGNVGVLSITWNLLPRGHWGGPSMYYCVYYRRHGDQGNNSRWMTVDNVPDPSLYVTVGLDNYYLPYEVKVQAVNLKGRGPNSTVAIVYSAEDVPTNIMPRFKSAKAINGTAGLITWMPVPNTREAARGSVFGYQVNYWLENTKCLGTNELDGMSSDFYGDVSSGLLLGLDFSGDYCVNIQFLNNAGMGPKTDNYYLGTKDAPPSLFPESVTVMSHGNDSVRLLWRGISTLFKEEPLTGYKAFWWDIREDIRSAKYATFDKVTTGVIRGIQRDVVYTLRVLGYSNGGDGKKSNAVYFTLGGEILYDPMTTDCMNGGSSISMSCLIYSVLGFIFITLDEKLSV